MTAADATTTSTLVQRIRARRTALAYALAALATSLVVLALYGRGSAGYDAAWALIWGRDLANGNLPNLDPVATAPTPHPLTNAVGALLSPLGDGALPAFQLLIVLSAGALGVACYALGRRLFTPLVGVLFAAIVLTRSQIVGEILLATIDIPFLALVIAAAAMEAQRPQRGTSVQVMLLLAGLLRPEAWLLAIAYAVYLRPEREHLVRVAALAVAAPLVWMGFDLIAEGDPLFSLHGTQALADTLDRPRGAGYAFSNTPTYLSAIVPTPLIWIGLAGWIASVWLLYERAVLPIALAVSGIACFLVLGATGLPVLTRYLLLPAVMIALFAAVGLAGWACFGAGRARTAWSVAAAVGLVLVLIAVPADRKDIRFAQEHGNETRRTQKSLHDVATQAGAARCGPVRVPHFRMRPLVAYWLDLPPQKIDDGIVGDTQRGVFFTPRTPAAVATFFFDVPAPAEPELRPPEGARAIAQSERWTLHEHCARPLAGAGGAG